MTHRVKSCETLPELISGMENGVTSLVNFAYVIRDLGCSSVHVVPEGLFALGEAMLEQARVVQEEWSLCNDLAVRMKRAST